VVLKKTVSLWALQSVSVIGGKTRAMNSHGSLWWPKKKVEHFETQVRPGGQVVLKIYLFIHFQNIFCVASPSFRALAININSLYQVSSSVLIIDNKRVLIFVQMIERSSLLQIINAVCLLH